MIYSCHNRTLNIYEPTKQNKGGTLNTELTFNRLQNEQSLYLKQHKDNPVHWWPYGPEALLFAKENNRPIFLSIGYSTCHWCHVMGHESFSDSDVADILNKNFVCIKVDKEEYPDLDQFYQKACQLFNQGGGGWPLSAFLLPDMRPFFVGTYFPLKRQGENMPSFPELLNELLRAYNEEKEQVLKNADQVMSAIHKGNIPQGEVKFEGHFPNPEAILKAVGQFKDNEWGSYGTAPKFPQFSFFEWAVEQMLEGMVSKEEGEFILMSLEKMLMGGILDHARGGIHRYSVDEKWLVPHFEKMLYDQAGLLKVLAKATLLYPSPLFFDTMINTLDYLENEMLAEKNYFFSAQDADSEGVEGLYFTFTEAEFEDALNKADSEDELLSKNLERLKSWFQITNKGNFENGLNVISLNPKFKEEFYKQENWDLIRKTRQAILQERKDRIPPQTDTKGVASWNFMLVSSLIDVIQYTQIDVIRKMASELLNKALDGMFDKFLVQRNDQEGMKLRHVTTLPESNPLLEDFVFFSESQLRLYEISGNAVFKQNFKDTLDFVNREFIDLNTDNGEKVFTRAKLATDFEAYPNIHASEFDQSFKSPLATLILLNKRAAALFQDRNYLDIIEKASYSATHTVLKVNPVNAGESLRALSYPNEVMRVIKVPRSWLKEDNFAKIIPYFLFRFVLDFHDKENGFEICSLSACEVQGTTLQEFMAHVVPDHGQVGTTA